MLGFALAVGAMFIFVVAHLVCDDEFKNYRA